MRLFEVAGNQFQDDLANVLKVMQGRANSKNTTSLIPWQRNQQHAICTGIYKYHSTIC
jgi:hypothetical protein